MAVWVVAFLVPVERIPTENPGLSALADLLTINNRVHRIRRAGNHRVNAEPVRSPVAVVDAANDRVARQVLDYRTLIERGRSAGRSCKRAGRSAQTAVGRVLGQSPSEVDSTRPTDYVGAEVYPGEYLDHRTTNGIPVGRRNGDRITNLPTGYIPVDCCRCSACGNMGGNLKPGQRSGIGRGLPASRSNNDRPGKRIAQCRRGLQRAQIGRALQRLAREGKERLAAVDVIRVATQETAAVIDEDAVCVKVYIQASIAPKRAAVDTQNPNALPHLRVEQDRPARLNDGVLAGPGNYPIAPGSRIAPQPTDTRIVVGNLPDPAGFRINYRPIACAVMRPLVRLCYRNLLQLHNLTASAMSRSAVMGAFASPIHFPSLT